MLKHDAFSLNFLVSNLDSQLGLRVKLFCTIWANKTVKIDKLFAFILCCYLVVIMHNFIAKVGRVLLVGWNTAIKASVLQKHDDFFRWRKGFFVREILVLRKQESPRFKFPNLFLIGGIFSIKVLVFGPVSWLARHLTFCLFNNFKLWGNLIIHWIEFWEFSRQHGSHKSIFFDLIKLSFIAHLNNAFNFWIIDAH